MIQITPQMRVLVAVEPADFRRGIDGLARMCREVLGSDPFSGTAFVFRNRRRTALKLLVYDGQGFWLCYKRPCRICCRWFRPHPRVGPRQKVCSSAACQRERHRRACRVWHRRNPDYDRESRFRRKLRCQQAEAGAAALAINPGRQLAWPAARDVVGLEVVVLVEEVLRLLVRWARDAVTAQTSRSQVVTSRHLRLPARDEIATAARAP